MATIYSNVNITSFNKLQLRRIARELQVPHDTLTTPSALITAIKAK